MDKQRAQHLLEDGYHEGHPSMVHGTTLDAALQLIRTGSLPPSKDYKGYLYFVPRKESFRGHPLYSSLVQFPDHELEGMVERYASANECEVAFKEAFPKAPKGIPVPDQGIAMLGRHGEILGFDETWDLDILTNPVWGKWAVKYLPKIKEALRNKNGVIIGLNAKALELKVENGDDDPGRTVRIHVPGGLNHQYVQYVFPLGNPEERALKEAIAKLS